MTLSFSVIVKFLKAKVECNRIKSIIGPKTMSDLTYLVNLQAVTKEADAAGAEEADAAGAEEEDVNPEGGLPESVAEPIKETEVNGTARAAGPEVSTPTEETQINEIQTIENEPEGPGSAKQVGVGTSKEAEQTEKLVDVQIVDGPVAVVTEEQTAPMLTEVLSQPETIKEDIVSEPEVIQTEVVIQIPPENAEKQGDVKAVEKATNISGIVPDIPNSVVSNETVPTLQPHLVASTEDKIPGMS